MSPAEVDAMIAKLGQFKDKLCGCPDQQCAEGVSTDMQAWGKGLKDPKLNDDQAKRTQAITEEMAKCAKRLMTMQGE